MVQIRRKENRAENRDGLPLMTRDEFLRWQLHQDKLYEYVDGRPVLLTKMMTGASTNHDRITVNALGHLFAQLRGKPCRPCTADIALEIPAQNRVRRPDLLVDCGEPAPKETRAAIPVLVLEVLSPSTRQTDMQVKLEEYKTVESLKVILLAEQDIAQLVLYRRDDQGHWQFKIFTDLQQEIPLPEIEARLTLADLYEGVTLAEER